MKAGISTASFFARMQIEETPAAIARMGCDTVEVFLNTPSEYAPAFVEQLAERIEQRSLKVWSVHAMGTQFEPQLFSLHDRQRKDALKCFEAVLSAAKRLNAGMYVFHGPATMRGTVKNVQMERVGPITHDLCDMAAAYGVALAWENVSWCLFQTPSFAVRIRDAAKHDNLKFTLDIKQAARSGYSPFSYLKWMGDALLNVHLCDYCRDGRKLRLMMPCQGEFNMDRLKCELTRMGYSGPVLVEVYSDLYCDLDELARCFERVQNALCDD
ncbi:MAG: sugar phosphate isomerase/epimerase [Bacillota bacterium]